MIIKKVNALIIKIILIAVIISGAAYSQFMNHKSMNWESIEQKLTNAQKMNYLNKIVSNEYYVIDNMAAEISKYHFIGVNTDSIICIIYEGRNPPGLETDDILFFKPQNDSLILTLKLFGNVEDIQFHDMQIMNMKVISYPCCSGYITFRRYYSFGHGHMLQLKPNTTYPLFQQEYFSDLINTYKDSTEAIDYCVETEKRDKYIYFNTPNDIYLTFDLAPVKNKEKPPEYAAYDSPYILEGNNQIAKIKANSNGIILSEQTNKEGDKYYFVRTNNSNSSQSIFGTESLIMYGWVPAKDIIVPSLTK